MQIAILTFDGFNELDSFVALSLLNRVHGWRATPPLEATTEPRVATCSFSRRGRCAHRREGVGIPQFRCR